ncbi:MAG: NUDIX hydrolase [Oscillospiraceae bacterium]|jgi:ADP-ribose pyrophosphatase|nr:NUDIX hydrolase [Oscillospiraceae bacterium]
MKFFEKQLESKTVYEGIIVNIRRDIVELSNGKKSEREIVEHPGGVGIVAITDEQKVLLVRQFRYPMQEETLEIPAGKLEYGEDPYLCAVRELSEETGYIAGRYIDFGPMYPSPGGNGEILYLYLALDLQKGEMHPDEGELLSLEQYDFDEVIAMIMRNELKDAKTIVGIMKAKEWLGTI